jgi:hypothetical protein
MYTQYRKTVVVSSRIEVRLWCGTSGVQEPFRIAIVPVSVTQSAVYGAFSNIAQLRGVPHAVETLFSPGATMPAITAKGDTATVLFGTQGEPVTTESVLGNFSGSSGVDPTTLWYYLVGYQNMAGTTTNNLQAQVMLEYKVKWYEPIATAVQVSVNKWGNEEIDPCQPPAKEEKKSDSDWDHISSKAAELSLDSVLGDKEELEALRKYKQLFLASKLGDSTVTQGFGVGAGAGGKPSGLGLLSRW